MAITVIAILKVKEVDLSPGDAEATTTQVCRARLYPACFTNSTEIGIIDCVAAEPNLSLLNNFATPSVTWSQ